MPISRRHGGAPLGQFPLNLPAFMGVNRQTQGAILGPEWATRLSNSVINDTNRISARNGWLKATTVAVGAAFVQMLEYDNAGSKELIATAADLTIHKSVDDGSTWTDITGTATVTDANMQLVIFNDEVVGFQAAGGTVVKYTGIGNFADNGAASEPGENVAVTAFGRIYAKDSATVVRYCDLLDVNIWTGAGAGVFDLTSIWQQQDEITGLAEFNNQLVVFSKRNIVLFDDSIGSVLGMDPTQAQVVDIVSGVGCIARDSIVDVKGDIWFLDDTGLHSLGRLLIQRSNPLINLSRPVQDELQRFVTAATVNDVRAIYSPGDRFYLISFPRDNAGAENGAAFCFDTRFQLEDGTYRCVGIWNNMIPTCPAVREDNTWFTSLTTKVGEIGQYGGFFDDTDPYIFDYESAWTNLQSEEYKILKRVSGLMLNDAKQIVNFKWAFDFDERFRSTSACYPGPAAPSEWNIGEWNIAEWGGGTRMQERVVGGSGYGEYIKIGYSARIAGAGLACQQIALYAKQGRTK